MTKCVCFIDYQDEKSSNFYNELLKNEKEFIYFKYLAWDSNFFGKDSFLLDISKSKFTPSEEVRLQIKDKFKECFITVKLDTKTDYLVNFFLQQCGFYYVDTEIELKLTNRKLVETFLVDFKLEELSLNESLPYSELGSVFELTRFHTDPNIDNFKADELWINYIKTFKVTSQQKMFVAYFQNMVCGVILANKYNDKTVICFVSVLKGFQNKNLGSAIMQYSIEKLGGVDIYTETQVKNIKALNFYIKNGFSNISKTMTVLHRWN